MQTFWGTVRTGTGSFIKITVQADNSYVAFQIMKATYGDALISAYAASM